ncbi:RNA-binding protein [Hyphomicrobium zavarzinii]|uniref:RNA-binding protein n=1 Tax=Hyphomicrobium zavarzinii TaxID=48292 RepID=UPI00037D00B2|nr:RNA-binding protein [Hyphomicrobium zavarzinii]
MADRRRQHDDAEPAVDGHGGERLCAATREALSPDHLIRFVADPSGDIVPDLARRLPGRGVWVKADKAVLERAVKANVFAKSLKRQVKADPALPERVEHLLEKRVLEALALANKAGLVTAGFQQVDELLEGGTTAVLVQASDAADGGRERLQRKYAAVARARGKEASLVTSLSTEQLSLAMGRSNVVHAALIQGGAAERFYDEAERLRRYRSGIGASDRPESARELKV